MTERSPEERRLPPLPIVIRPEAPADYHAIAEMTALAHNTEMEVGLLIASLRQHRAFDPELALVAEWEGRPVGHALFLPLEVLIGGERVPAVTLWVLTVAPGCQRRGTGTRLMAEGHERARRRGCCLSFLLGHESYYPRAGYRTVMFGTCRARVLRAALRPSGAEVTERPPQPEDTAELVRLWWRWLGDVDLAIVPEATISDWLSPYKPMADSVLLRGGELAGYARYEQGKPQELRCFLARDGASTIDLLAYLSDKAGGDAHGDLLVPVHPHSRTARAWLPPEAQAEITPWSAAMIKVLRDDCAPLVAYVEEVTAGTRPIGCLIWPVQGDVV